MPSRIDAPFGPGAAAFQAHLPKVRRAAAPAYILVLAPGGKSAAAGACARPQAPGKEESRLMAGTLPGAGAGGGD
jgi:hypothetical protein